MRLWEHSHQTNTTVLSRPQFPSAHRHKVYLIVDNEMDIDALSIAKSLLDYAGNIWCIVPQFGGQLSSLMTNYCDFLPRTATSALKGFQHIEDGVHITELNKSNRAILKQIIMAGIGIGFKYSGQSTTCYHCQSTEHVVNNCPKKWATQRQPPVPPHTKTKGWEPNCYLWLSPSPTLTPYTRLRRKRPLSSASSKTPWRNGGLNVCNPPLSQEVIFNRLPLLKKPLQLRWQPLKTTLATQPHQINQLPRTLNALKPPKSPVSLASRILSLQFAA